MIQLMSVLIALLGLAYNGVKDYQKGEIQLPILPQKQVLTKTVYPVQYCVMAYDPNLDRIFYLHENGQWYDFPPQIRKYQNQGQEVLGTPNGAQPAQIGQRVAQQPAQASAYPSRY